MWPTVFPSYLPVPEMKTLSFRKFSGTSQSFPLNEETVEASRHIEIVLENVGCYSLEKLFLAPPAFAFQGSSGMISANKKTGTKFHQLHLVHGENKVGTGLLWVRERRFEKQNRVRMLKKLFPVIWKVDFEVLGFKGWK